MGDRRLKISDLARGAGISRSTATKLYHGGTDVNLSVVDRVCRALQADLCELFEYVPNGAEETPEQPCSLSNEDEVALAGWKQRDGSVTRPGRPAASAQPDGSHR